MRVPATQEVVIQGTYHIKVLVLMNLIRRPDRKRMTIDVTMLIMN